MMSLFTSFDLFIFYKIYIIFFLSFSLVTLKTYKLGLLSLIMGTTFQKWMGKFFISLKPKGFNKFSLTMISSIMLTILVLNFFSVFSFMFPLTSQFGMVFSIALLSWISLSLFNLCSNFKGFMAHLIPEGTPIYLTSLLYLIELTSSLIRPITLTVRLVANILAGHLLMILLSKLVFLFPSTMFFTYILLNSIEMMVALIQSYIFATMVTLYFAEVH